MLPGVPQPPQGPVHLNPANVNLVVTYSYTYGLVTTATEPGNRTTTLQFGPDRNPAAVINPLGARQAFVWDQGRLVAGVNANGSRTTNVFDEAGRSIATIDP